MTRRVLMVDDEEALVWCLVRRVRRERSDLEVEGLTDPAEALERVSARCPDVLITDVCMPRMSGLELLLAARRTCPRLPVLVVTAHGDARVRTEVQKAGAVQYMEKPFSVEDLLGAIDRALVCPAGEDGAADLPLLPDLIQIYAIGRLTGALRVVRSPEAGEVWFEAGEIVHATCGSRSGVEAVSTMLPWTGGTFSVLAGLPAPMRTVQTPWRQLLLAPSHLDGASRGRDRSCL